MLSFGVQASAEGANLKVPAAGFQVPKLPAVVALGRRGGRVGHFDLAVVAK